MPVPLQTLSAAAPGVGGLAVDRVKNTLPSCSAGPRYLHGRRSAPSPPAAAQFAGASHGSPAHARAGLRASRQHPAQVRGGRLCASTDEGPTVTPTWIPDVDTDTRYFDGDLLEGDDADYLGLDHLDADVLPKPEAQAAGEEAEAKEEKKSKKKKKKKKKELESSYLDEDVWHVIDFWDLVVSIKKGPKVIVESIWDDETEVDELYSYDFSEVWMATKVDAESEEALEQDAPPTLVFKPLPTKHLADVPPQFYETVDWTRLNTINQDNGPEWMRLEKAKELAAAEGLDEDEDEDEIQPVPAKFLQTEHQTVKMYFIRDLKPSDLEGELDFSEVYVLDSEDMTLTRSKVEGLELCDNPNATLVLRADGLRVVDETKYPTADELIDQAELEKYHSRTVGRVPEGTFDLPANFGEDGRLNTRVDPSEYPDLFSDAASNRSDYTAEPGDGDPDATDIPAVDIL